MDEQPRFGGEPGEPVPTVDPEDMKTVWQINKDAEARHPDGRFAIGINVFRHACKPGANVEAVCERVIFLRMMNFLAPDDPRFTGKGQPDDAIFRALATVPAEWMGVGTSRPDPPFNVQEFLRLSNEVKKYTR